MKTFVYNNGIRSFSIKEFDNKNSELDRLNNELKHLEEELKRKGDELSKVDPDNSYKSQSLITSIDNIKDRIKVLDKKISETKKSSKKFSTYNHYTYVYVDYHETTNNRYDSAVHVTDDPSKALDFLKNGSYDSQILVFTSRQYAEEFANAIRSGNEDQADSIWERYSRFDGISDPDEFKRKFLN